jgi:hypothetical protein
MGYHLIMSNAKGERQVAKKGFGTAMVNHLREVDYASTDDLAKIAGVTTEQAYSRLMFLQSQEKLVVSTGKGAAKLWSMADKAPPPVPVIAATKEESVGGAFNKNHGWKPSLRGREAIGGLLDVKKGDKLLVEYPEGWRHTALVSVCREPTEDGVAQCWDIRGSGYTYVPVGAEAMAKYNVKVVRVNGEKDLITLENA